MNKYTPEPWFVMHGLDGIFIVSENTGGMVARIYGAEAESNAQRIVACIKACEHYSTERIKGMSVLEDKIGADFEIRMLKKQRDDLLKALTGLLSEAEVIAQVIPAYGGSQNIKNARAAIAKAGGVNNG